MLKIIKNKYTILLIIMLLSVAYIGALDHEKTVASDNDLINAISQ